MFSKLKDILFNKRSGLSEGGFNPSKKRNSVDVVIRDAAGNIKFQHRTYNLRTNVGIDFVADALSKSPQPAPANYIAVSTDVAAAAAGDTVLASELAVSGLTRALGTYTHTSFATTYTVDKTFTVTGGPHTVTKAALFNAAVAGTMVFEALFGTSATVNGGDTLSVTWSITI